MSNGARTAVQVVLLLVIVALAYWLYRAINDPWAERARIEAITDGVRDRMTDNKQALLRFYEVNRRYPGTLDSLMLFVRSDSLIQANADSLFGSYPLDSLTYSPRSGNRFLYTASDTARVAYYKLTDPDNPADFIGTDRGEITLINASSWE